MSVHFDATRGPYAVRWRQDGRNRSRAEAEAERRSDLTTRMIPAQLGGQRHGPAAATGALGVPGA